MPTCWPSAQHKQQTRCSWCVSSPTRACSLVTEPVCVQSNMSGRQTACTSALQGCGGPKQGRKGTSASLGRSYTDHVSDFYPKSSQAGIEEAPDFPENQSCFPWDAVHGVSRLSSISMRHFWTVETRTKLGFNWTGVKLYLNAHRNQIRRQMVKRKGEKKKSGLDIHMWIYILGAWHTS